MQTAFKIRNPQSASRIQYQACTLSNYELSAMSYYRLEASANPNSEFRILHSAFQIPHSEFRIPHSESCIPNSAFKEPLPCQNHARKFCPCFRNLLSIDRSDLFHMSFPSRPRFHQPECSHMFHESRYIP